MPVPVYPDASGKIIINKPGGDVVLIINLNVEGLAPNTNYKAFGRQGIPGDKRLIGEFITNKHGDGHLHRNYLDGELLPYLKVITVGEPKLKPEPKVLITLP